MKYSLAAVPALAAVALAQGEKPAFLNTAFDVTEGKPFTLQYSGCQDGCIIELRNGPATDLKLVKQITADATGSSFTWTPEGLPSDTYTFQISRRGGQPNYSIPFTYQGTGAVSSAASSPATSLTTAASSAASSASSAATSVSSASASVTMSTVARETTAASTPTGRNGTASGTGSSSTRPSTSVTSIPTAGVGRVSVPWPLLALPPPWLTFF